MYMPVELLESTKLQIHVYCAGQPKCQPVGSAVAFADFRRWETYLFLYSSKQNQIQVPPDFTC